MALLELRSVSKHFGGLQALARVDLQLHDGMIASLIGPNGAGKTTLFNILTGIYRPDEGQIVFAGRSLVGLTPDKITAAGISRSFQNIRLFGHMTVLENVLVGMHSRLQTSVPAILLGAKQFHLQEQVARSKAMELIELAGLAGREMEWAEQLPYGDQRRLELARALAAAPQLLLLDEPTAGMNSSEARSLMALAFPQTKIDASDLSAEALSVARVNVARYGLARRVRLRRSDLFAGLPRRRYDLIVSNPPYVPSVSEPGLTPEVRDYEPPVALFSGEDGLDALRSMLHCSAARLAPRGWLIMEFGLGQDGCVESLVNEVSGIDLVKIRHDLQDIPRTVVCRKAGSASLIES